jgi:hypothetical protein
MGAGMSKRFVLEGTWRGYRSSQDHVCHREVCTEKKAEWAKRQHSIPFSDGTCLLLSARPALPREHVVLKPGYTSLIADYFYDIKGGAK